MTLKMTEGYSLYKEIPFRYLNETGTLKVYKQETEKHIDLVLVLEYQDYTLESMVPRLLIGRPWPITINIEQTIYDLVRKLHIELYDALMSSSKGLLVALNKTIDK